MSVLEMSGSPCCAPRPQLRAQILTSTSPARVPAPLPADNAARFYSALKETPYEEHVKIILMTGEGLNISKMNMDLWQPISPLRVESMADMSVRLTDEQ